MEKQQWVCHCHRMAFQGAKLSQVTLPLSPAGLPGTRLGNS